MYTQQYDQPFHPPPNNITLFKKIGFVVFIGLVVLGMFFLLRPKTKIDSHTISSTPLDANKNFVHLDGDSIYSFNGMTFSRINTTDRTVTILYGKQKLPKPSRIHWAGDTGALLTFEGSFQATAIQDQLKTLGLKLDERTKFYTWFLDFNSGQLALVNKNPISNRLAYYDNSAKGFYYVSDMSIENIYEHDGLLPETYPLNFFSIENQQNKVLSADLRVTDISHIGPCNAPEYKICFIAKEISDLANDRLYGVSAQNSKDEIFNSGGRLYATNNTNFLITSPLLEDSDSSHNQPQSRPTDIPEISPSIYDLRYKKAHLLNFKTDGAEIFSHFSEDGRFYILSNAARNSGVRDQYIYHAGVITNKGSLKLAPKTLFTNDKKVFSGQLIDDLGHNNFSKMLVADIQGVAQLVQTETEPALSLSISDSNLAEKFVKDCAGNHADGSQYFETKKLFRVLYVGEAISTEKLEAFIGCLHKSDPLIAIGYSFYVGTISPSTGRLTSD